MAQWPGVRLSKTNTDMAHTSGYVEKKFQSSIINSFGCRARKPRSSLIVASLIIIIIIIIIKRIVPIL